MLKSIQLTGFKSFAKKGELSFESAITAIVGPNGSGKSNTAEAFRFVLGEQGSKSMRVKKGTDLIWGGSHTLPKGSRAGVRVVLDNSKNALNIDFNEVVIERSVLRDGTNEYSINGSKVRLKDVHDVLAGANIGSSGHHIISQGEADRVLGASPKERKEMLEDALGLKVYQLKKVEALRKLDATSQNLEKVESRRRELLPHLKFLERQVQRVEQAYSIKMQLKEQASIYFINESEWIHNEQRELQSLIINPTKEIQQVEQNIAKIRSNINEAKQAQVENKQHLEGKQIVQNEQNKLIALRSTLATLRTELGKVRGQLEMLKVVEKRTKDLPNAISRKKVKEVLERAMQMLDSNNINKAKEIIHTFIESELLITQVAQEPDNAIEQERDALYTSEKELLEQLAGQEQAISKQERVVADAQQNTTQDTQRYAEYERDLYKETARYNELKAELAELGRRQERVTARKLSLSENLGEVQIVIGEEIDIAIKRSDLQGEVRPHDDKSIPTHKDIERLKIQLEQHGNLSAEVIDEHKEAQKHNDFLIQEITDLQDTINKLTELIKQLDEHMHERFNKGLMLINREFNSFFNTLFDGGNASLQLIELKSASDDADDEQKEVQYGVDVQVHLPRKKVTTLETLSGGERALASIALIFAMSQVNPPPFIILDETDAALDEANSQRYANIVKKLSERSQIILITHNRATMAAADTLYGVTMGSDGVSQLLSVKLTEAEAFAK